MVSTVLSQRPTNLEEIRRGNLTKLRRHLGKSIPPDLIAPRLDRDELSDSSSSDEEQDVGPITPESPSNMSEGNNSILEEATNRQSRRWIWEKKGRRWEEDDYRLILQRLRELR
jgi:hypothetical protein